MNIDSKKFSKNRFIGNEKERVTENEMQREREKEKEKKRRSTHEQVKENGMSYENYGNLDS